MNSKPHWPTVIFCFGLFMAFSSLKNLAEKHLFPLPSKARAEALQNRHITADELLKALGGTVFDVTLPDSIPENSMVGLTLRSADGRIAQRGGAIGLGPKLKKLRLVIFGDKDPYSASSEKLEYALLTEEENGYKGAYRIFLPLTPNSHKSLTSSGGSVVFNKRINTYRVAKPSAGTGYVQFEEGGDLDLILTLDGWSQPRPPNPR